MLTIMTNVAMNNKAGVIGGVSYADYHSIQVRKIIFIRFARVFETFMGVFVAIVVNSMWIIQNFLSL